MLALILAALLQGPPLPPALTAPTFRQVHIYAMPTAKDLSFQSLDWHNSVFEGLAEAQRQDKPLLLWQYFGDPRGHC